MASNVIPFKESAVPAHIAALFGAGNNSEYESTSVSVPSMSFRGKVWRIVIGGEENILTNAEGEAVATAEVVMLKGNPNRSKAYYGDKKYTEGGEDQAPVCASRDGISPDEGVEAPQCDNCAACPQNVWGSKINDQGKKVKACSDSKRIAIVPAGDLGFTPLKLNVPATSLSDKDNKENEAKGWYALSEYAKMLEQRGVPVEAVVTKIGFDSRTAYPKLLFKAVGYLGEDDAEKVKALRDSDALDDIVGIASGNAPAKPVAAAPVNDEPPAAAKPVETPKAAAKPKAAKPVEKPVPAAVPPEEDDDTPPTTVVKAAAVAPDEPASDSLKSKVADILGGLDIEDEE